MYQLPVPCSLRRRADIRASTQRTFLQRIRCSLKLREQHRFRDMFQPERPAADFLEASHDLKGVRASGPPNSIVFRLAAGCRSATAQISATSRKETQLIGL